MTREDEHTLLWLAGLFFLSELSDSVRAYTENVVPALEHGGARVYDLLHDDAAHKQDLPGRTLTRPALLALATQTGFRDPKLAAAIALAESGGVTGAILRSSIEYSVGLWQINTLAHPQYSVDDMKDPIKNARAAFAISKGGTDWHQWPTFTHGKYKQFKTGILA